MTKLVWLRVAVLVDDQVQTLEVQKRLKSVLRAMPAEQLATGEVPKEGTPVLPLDDDAGRQVFWPGADVKQGAGTVVRTASKPT